MSSFIYVYLLFCLICFTIYCEKYSILIFVYFFAILGTFLIILTPTHNITVSYQEQEMQKCEFQEG